MTHVFLILFLTHQATAEWLVIVFTRGVLFSVRHRKIKNALQRTPFMKTDVSWWGHLGLSLVRTIPYQNFSLYTTLAKHSFSNHC